MNCTKLSMSGRGNFARVNHHLTILKLSLSTPSIGLCFQIVTLTPKRVLFIKIFNINIVGAKYFINNLLFVLKFNNTILIAIT